MKIKSIEKDRVNLGVSFTEEATLGALIYLAEEKNEKGETGLIELYLEEVSDYFWSHSDLNNSSIQKIIPAEETTISLYKEDLHEISNILDTLFSLSIEFESAFNMPESEFKHLKTELDDVHKAVFPRNVSHRFRGI